jgi:predicted RNA-binding Zn-ribbon protein involved in translation (DUF1610 family)
MVYPWKLLAVHHFASSVRPDPGEEKVKDAQSPAKRSCPNCGSADIFRSHRRGPIERYLIRAIGMRPYRCLNCDGRYYFFSLVDQESSPDAKAA